MPLDNGTGGGGDGTDPFEGNIGGGGGGAAEPFGRKIGGGGGGGADLFGGSIGGGGGGGGGVGVNSSVCFTGGGVIVDALVCDFDSGGGGEGEVGTLDTFNDVIRGATGTNIDSSIGNTSCGIGGACSTFIFADNACCFSGSGGEISGSMDGDSVDAYFSIIGGVGGGSGAAEVLFGKSDVIAFLSHIGEGQGEGGGGKPVTVSHNVDIGGDNDASSEPLAFSCISWDVDCIIDEVGSADRFLGSGGGSGDISMDTSGCIFCGTWHDSGTRVGSLLIACEGAASVCIVCDMWYDSGDGLGSFTSLSSLAAGGGGMELEPLFSSPF